MAKQLIFFGSSPFSNIVLEKVLGSRFEVISVVTTEDKPAGRHLQLTPNPVKVLAQKNNIPILEPNHYNLEPGVIGLVAAYGKIIKQEVLNAFAGRIYNIHPSLLPKYRGASPLQQQILDGVSETGVTIIQMDEQVDHGPIVAQEKDVIRPDDTWKTLGNRLFARGAEIFLKLEPKTYNLKPQNESEATFTKKLTRQDGFVTWEEFKRVLDTNPAALDPKMRAFQDWPGVWTLTPNQKRLKLVSLHPPLFQQEGQSLQSWDQYKQPYPQVS